MKLCDIEISQWLLDQLLSIFRVRKHLQTREIRQSDVGPYNGHQLLRAIDYLEKRGDIDMTVEGWSPVYHLPLKR
jgi:hypothetical protein